MLGKFMEITVSFALGLSVATFVDWVDDPPEKIVKVKVASDELPRDKCQGGKVLSIGQNFVRYSRGNVYDDGTIVVIQNKEGLATVCKTERNLFRILKPGTVVAAPKGERIF